MPSTQTDRLNGTTTSVAIKAPCKAVTTTAITQTGEQTIGGVACVDGDRYLYAITAGSALNGIWVVSTGAHTRATDFDGSRDVVTGTAVLVKPGSADEQWWHVTTATSPIIPGTTSITFEQHTPEELALRADLADGVTAGMGYNLVAITRTAAEVSVGVTPTNYLYQPGDVRRYGAGMNYNGSTGTDDTTAWQNAILVAQASSDPATYASNSPASGTCKVFAPSGLSKITSELVITKKIAIEGEGAAEFSSGTRLIQMSVNSHLFRVAPIAQGMSLSISNLTMRGAGSGNGDLLLIQRTTANCNSVRLVNLVFGTPSRFGLNIEAGDDILIDRPLFDASSGSVIALGTATAAKQVTNCIIDKPVFFDVPTNAILAYNVNGLTINNPHVYPATTGHQAQFINASDTLPYLVQNVKINGGVMQNVDCLFVVNATGVTGLSVDGVVASGIASTRSWVELNGTCTRVTWNGGSISGAFSTKNAYNDDGATVTGLNISGVSMTATSGSAAAIKCLNATGKIGTNTYTGWALNVQATDYTAIGMPELTANNAQWIRGNLSEEITLSTSGLTTNSDANLLPANSIIEAVVGRVTTTITTATDWKLGDGTIAGRFSAANSTLTAGTTQVGLVHIDQTGTSGPRQAAAAALRITCTGANPGAGKIRVTVFYRQFVPPTS